jgi:predicted DsbA family dithiol-disulfide isomerase
MAARLAHQFAIESARVTADVIQVNEFPDLVQRYRVRGVPKVVINEKVQFEGAVPEAQFISQVLLAVNGRPKPTAEQEGVDG